MSLRSKVAWKEGIFLQPQHFQQLERSIESTLHSRLRAHLSPSWGVFSCALDEQSLGGGRLELKQLHALMPDGAVVHVPDVDAAPPSRKLKFPPTGKHIDIFVGLPHARPRVPLVVSDPNRGDVRYYEETLDVTDDCDLARIQPVDVAVKNLQFVLGDEPQTGLVCLRVGRVERTEGGTFRLAPNHAPPALNMEGIPEVLERVRGLMSALTRRLDLAADTATGPLSTLTLDRRMLTELWLIQAVTPHLARLQVQIENQPHPRVLFESLAALRGSLHLFSNNRTFAPMPYHHEEIFQCFANILEDIRGRLPGQSLARFLRIPFIHKEHFWEAKIEKTQLLDDVDVFLEVYSQARLQDSFDALRRNLKVVEKSNIWLAIKHAVKGLRLVPEFSPRQGLPVKPDTWYFELAPNRSDPEEVKEWNAFRNSGHLACYVPQHLTKIHLTLVLLRRNG